MCSDPEREWFPQREVCYATLAQAEARRRYEAKHAQHPFHDGTFQQWAPKQLPGWFRFDEGVTIWVSAEDVRPDDNWL